jgi:hypothetical protein
MMVTALISVAGTAGTPPTRMRRRARKVARPALLPAEHRADDDQAEGETARTA